MIKVHQFVFNEFLENTYVVWDNTRACVIIDPGCHHDHEKKELEGFIKKENLLPVLLLNTHCHLDHIFGNNLVKETWGIPFLAHREDLFLLNAMTATASFYGMQVEPSPMPDQYLNEGDEVKFGSSALTILFTPGHSPGSVCFYHEKENFIISGDVLFQSGIGRTDLPGGDYETLMQSICNELLTLSDEVIVYNGHGPATSIGQERKTNPFILEYLADVKAK